VYSNWVKFQAIPRSLKFGQCLGSESLWTILGGTWWDSLEMHQLFLGTWGTLA
jgi:hypothetical protein